MNERRQRYENQPYGLSWEILFSNLFSKDHPYSWPTIGWMKDIEKFELNDVIEFFKKYYAPNNASLVIGGNFEIQNAIDLVEKYFGEIKSGIPVEPIKAPEQKLFERKEIIHEDNVQLPRIHLAWHTTKAFDTNDAALDILAEILSGGKNSRLNKSLVFEKQIAQDVSAFQYSAKLTGTFIIVSTAKPNVELDLIKKEIFAQLEKLISEGVKDEELQKAKNSFKSSFVYALQKLDNVVDHMNYYNFHLNEPNSFAYDLNRYESITADDVVDAAKKYLTQNFVQLNVIPKKIKNDK
jgi:zinc protease